MAGCPQLRAVAAPDVLTQRLIICSLRSYCGTVAIIGTFGCDRRFSHINVREEMLMRSLFFATCLALGAGSLAMVAPAQARVSVDLPGIHIGDDHRHGDWGRHEEWRRHEGYRYDRGERYGYNNGYREWR
jgi:hypothetical protein